MKDKKRGLSIGLIAAAVGVVMLGADKLLISANSSANFFQSFSVVTIIALVILLGAGAWLFWISFQ